MEYLQDTVKGFFGRFLISQENSPPTSGIDLCLSRLYMILTWQDFDLSLGAFAVINVLLWLIVRFEIRFYATVCLSLLVLLFCHLYCEIHNIGNDPGSLYQAGQQIKNYFTSRLIYLQKLRKENPAIFCTVMSGLFCVLSCVSKVFSGLQITYFLVYLLFSLPPLMSPNVEIWKHFLKVHKTRADEDDSSSDDFNAEDFNDDIESLTTDQSTDSFTSSLENELTTMPSYSEVDYDGEEPVTEDKLLIDPSELWPQNLLQDSDSDSETKSMNFVSTHFKNSSSSSSSDEENQEAPFVMTKALMLHLIDCSLSEGPAPVEVDASTESVNRSSDSEFELIDYDDVKDS